MLSSWGALNDPAENSDASDNDSVVMETDEAREGRLRGEYIAALATYAADDLPTASKLFRALVGELPAPKVVAPDVAPAAAASPAAAVAAAPPPKRKRSKRETPDWVRSLRYVTCRNLAECEGKRGVWRDALTWYCAALDCDVGDIVIWRATARAAARCGMTHVARAAVERACAARPGDWLSERERRFVLEAVGDGDEDCGGVGEGSDFVELMVRERARGIQEEARVAKKERDAAGSAEFLNEPTWRCCAVALRACLRNRLAPGRTRPIWGRVLLKLRREPISGSNHARDILVEETVDLTGLAEKEGEKRDVEMVAVVDSKIEPGEGGAGSDYEGNDANGDDEDKKRVEVRKSKRQADLGRDAARERKRRREVSSNLTSCDWGLAEYMMSLVTDIPAADGDSDEGAWTKPHETVKDPILGDEPGVTASYSPWNTKISQAAEEAEVALFVSDTKDNENGGPLDLLLRILRRLLDMESRQYHNTIAAIWLSVKDDVPSSFLSSASDCLIISEALFTAAEPVGIEMENAGRARSGKVTEKRKQKLVESRRVLACALAAGITGICTASFFDGTGQSVRWHWLYAQLADGEQDMQVARDHVLKCVDLLSSLIKSEKYVNYSFQPSAGYVFTGMTAKVALSFVEAASLRFQVAGELEDARLLVSSATSDDIGPAKKALLLLFPAVQSSIGRLCFASEKSNSRSAKLPEPESRYRDVLESQLETFSQACAACKDDAGGLVVSSVSLMLLVADHTHAWNLHGTSVDSPGGSRADVGNEDAASEFFNAGFSPAVKLSDIVAQLRPYVASIRKVTSLPPSVGLDLGVGGWSARSSLVLAAKTLVSVSHLLQAKIKAMPLSATADLSLAPSEKNQRLAFSRAMLGFGRCIDSVTIIHLVNQSSLDPGSANSLNERTSATKHVLKSLQFALFALVPRGCLREEGTGGALIKLYMSRLRERLHQLAELSIAIQSSGPAAVDSKASAVEEEAWSIDSSDDDEDGKKSSVHIPTLELAGKESVDWDDVRVIRRALAECLQCVYRLPDLELLVGGGKINRRLSDGVDLSKRVGVSFNTLKASNSTKLDPETCFSAFGFYRPFLFEALGRWRDGKKSRRAREVVASISEALSFDDVPFGLCPVLPLKVINMVQDKAHDHGSRAAITFLFAEWDKARASSLKSKPANQNLAQTALSSHVFYEARILHAASIWAWYESEFKKQKSVPLRKTPKEAFVRLRDSAQSECIAAIRHRPWSAEAWILLGRVFLEIADVALDEREYVSSAFGVCNPPELSSRDAGDPIVTVLDRATVCFCLADFLAKKPWPAESGDKIDLSLLDADAFGCALDIALPGSAMKGTAPIEGLFDFLGLVRGGADKNALRAASHFGQAAALVTRLREERYRSRAWRLPFTSPRVLCREADMFPAELSNLAGDALETLEKGMSFAFTVPCNDRNSSGEEPGNGSGRLPSAKSVFSSLSWYYKLQCAKLYRKRGDCDPVDYLDLFAEAAAENVKTRALTDDPPDLEPLYKLHATRLKLLLEQSESKWPGLLAALERHSFDASLATRSDCATLTETQRERLIAQDVSQAMEHCRKQKPSHAWSEYFFKAAFIRALALWKFLDDRRGAIVEMESVFRGCAAARVIEPNSDGTHRGYFFTMWNYRHTDTGHEMAIETERKYLRWRNKLLGLYGALLDVSNDAHMVAGIISRLKRRSSDDLPVNGALLDDFVGLYGEISIRLGQKAQEDSSFSPTVAVSEASLRRTWDVFLESIRLAVAAKRTRQAMERKTDTALNPEAILKPVVDSSRPWCLFVSACAVHFENCCLLSAKEGKEMGASKVISLVINDEPLDKIDPDVFKEMAVSLDQCLVRWPTDSKNTRLVRRRIDEYQNGGPHVKSQSSSRLQAEGLIGDGCDPKPVINNGDTLDSLL